MTHNETDTRLELISCLHLWILKWGVNLVWAYEHVRLLSQRQYPTTRFLSWTAAVLLQASPGRSWSCTAPKLWFHVRVVRFWPVTYDCWMCYSCTAQKFCHVACVIFIICKMTRKHLLKLLCWVTISRMIMSETYWNLNVPFHIAAWYPAAVTRRWAKRYDSPSRTAGLLQDPSFTTSSWLLHVFWRWLPLLIWDFNSDIMA